MIIGYTHCSSTVAPPSFSAEHQPPQPSVASAVAESELIPQPGPTRIISDTEPQLSESDWSAALDKPTAAQPESDAAYEAPHSTVDSSPEVLYWKGKVASVKKSKDALRKKLSRCKARLSKTEAALAHSQAKLAALEQFHVKHQGIITTPTRALVRALVLLGAPQKNIFPIMSLVLGSHGIQVVGSFDPHSVRRIVLEGGVLAMCQLGKEMSETASK